MDRTSVGRVGTHHYGIAVGIDDNLELDRAAAHGAIFYEPLAPAAGGIDADIVRFEATRALVGRIGLERHVYRLCQLGDDVAWRKALGDLAVLRSRACERFMTPPCTRSPEALAALSNPVDTHF